MPNKFVCIHGHFYQPPRENPWLNEVEMQDSAYPFHDWNARITAECYARNSASRILDHDGDIVEIVNNYSRISFNFGPTLLSWMQRMSPDVYEAILEADRESLSRFSGHGSALAQVFNHMIMPLANKKDKITQVIWGIRDFYSRFQRAPEGMWLGETAVDTETLEVLADHGIKFTILSPYQANRFRSLKELEQYEARKKEQEAEALKRQQEEQKKIREKEESMSAKDKIARSIIDPKPELENEEENNIVETVTEPAPPTAEPDFWHDATNAKIDPRNSYLCRLPSGKSIALFFYDGPISQGIAFEGMLNNGSVFAQRLLEQVNQTDDVPRMVNIATDGESYGHHHRFGEMALSVCLHEIENRPEAQLSIYGEFLEKYPPQYEVEITENTSWSCYHGVERWRSNCGCNTGGRPGWNQEWRGPLRDSFDWLRDQVEPEYEKLMQEYVEDPWHIRNEYIDLILDRSIDNANAFIAKNAKRRLDDSEKTKLLKLLEIQYHAMLMYTSCGWFFDEVTGIETMQDIFYASRCIQLAEDVLQKDFEKQYLELLKKVPSNLPEHGNAANAYQKFVIPSKVDLMRVGAHYAVSSVFLDYPEEMELYSYTVKSISYKRSEAGKQRLSIGKALLRSNVTLEENILTFAILYLGDHHLFGGIRKFTNESIFQETNDEMEQAFNKSNVHEIIVMMDKHFGTHNYSFWHLFKDDQKKVLDQVLENTTTMVEGLFRQMYENNYPIMQAVKELSMPLPNALKVPVDFIVNSKVRRILEKEEIDLDELQRVAEEINRLDVELDTLFLNYLATQRVTQMMEQFFETPDNIKLMESIVISLEIFKSTPLTLDLWRVENLAFLMKKIYFEGFSYRSKRGDLLSKSWVDLFKKLYLNLNMKL